MLGERAGERNGESTSERQVRSFDAPAHMRAEPSSLRRGHATCSSLASLAACSGQQSALDPAGRDADRLADLFWWMTGGTALIWLATISLTLYAAYFSRRPIDTAKTRRLVVGGGVVLPTVVLTGLLAYGLALIPRVLAPAPAGSLRVHVTGEQYWWRVAYLSPGGDAVELANELRLPVDEPVELELDTRDVIHSLWIPALGGKMDMIPGRRTRLRLHPTRTGVYRGTCAEYCGTSHAHMSFAVVVLEKAEFEAWLARQAEPARSPPEALAARGGALFQSNGCGACHAIRGTAARGRVAPDLTHVGSRETVGAGRLANDRAALEHWVARPDELKPGVLMPAFGMLPPDDVAALAAYLESLR
jgi:cytochrome c oxidase subunit 2